MPSALQNERYAAVLIGKLHRVFSSVSISQNFHVFSKPTIGLYRLPIQCFYSDTDSDPKSPFVNSFRVAMDSCTVYLSAIVLGRPISLRVLRFFVKVETRFYVSTRDNIAPKPFLLFSSFDSYRPYIYRPSFVNC